MTYGLRPIDFALRGRPGRGRPAGPMPAVRNAGSFPEGSAYHGRVPEIAAQHPAAPA